MSALDQLALRVMRWRFNARSCVPYAVRGVLANSLLGALLSIYRCRMVMNRRGWM